MICTFNFSSPIPQTHLPIQRKKKIQELNDRGRVSNWRYCQRTSNDQRGPKFELQTLHFHRLLLSRERRDSAIPETPSTKSQLVLHSPIQRKNNGFPDERIFKGAWLVVEFGKFKNLKVPDFAEKKSRYSNVDPMTQWNYSLVPLGRLQFNFPQPSRFSLSPFTSFERSFDRHCVS